MKNLLQQTLEERVVLVDKIRILYRENQRLRTEKSIPNTCEAGVQTEQIPKEQSWRQILEKKQILMKKSAQGGLFLFRRRAADEPSHSTLEVKNERSRRSTTCLRTERDTCTQKGELPQELQLKLLARMQRAEKRAAPALEKGQRLKILLKGSIRKCD